ncbi:secoisolariciresinol dehydrogenase-like [Cornus florida]|uniref:secoisolariciresinol dehydrogenase-like n=1 Tax=Cornus florida TaxID=4283 RepID=UPI00289AB10A|nr:secoisolariciresinol dehydrogenase-like [Cornus florida]XP_059627768.1 secoisolariciresinol dehydrogenase-like [Cornus florida]
MASLLSNVARRLEGKVALITGGSGGIGASTAKLFCQQGAKVMIADIQDDLGHSVCNDLGPAHASFVHCDITNETDVQNAIDKSVAKHGKLDIMFNNAGLVTTGSLKPCILDNEKADFEKILHTNVVGSFLGTKHAARVMIPAGHGTIINMASVCSVIGGVASHDYTCSKHALLGLTRNTAVELGKHGIRVNCVSPYVVRTELAMKIIPDELFKQIFKNLKGIPLKPEDVAEAVLYLASDESKYVSGHNLVVDGGFTVVNQALSMFSE